MSIENGVRRYKNGVKHVREQFQFHGYSLKDIEAEMDNASNDIKPENDPEIFAFGMQDALVRISTHYNLSGPYTDDDTYIKLSGNG